MKRCRLLSWVFVAGVLAGPAAASEEARAMAEDTGLYGLVFETGRYDTGNKLDWLRATMVMALRHPEVGPGFRTALAEIVHEEGIALQ